jgi:cold shock CspA family protein
MLGSVGVYFPARSFGFLRDQLSGADIFFHQADVEFDLGVISKGLKVEFETTTYLRDGEQKTKAVRVRLARGAGESSK